MNHNLRELSVGEPVPLPELSDDERVRQLLLDESTTNLAYIVYFQNTGREPPRNDLTDKPEFPAELTEAIELLRRRQMLSVFSGQE